MSYVLSFRNRRKLPTHIPGLAPPPANLVGRFSNLDPSVNWSTFIPIPNGPIKYLEIGCADGGNAIIISNSYCSHPDSKIYCVDPWFDYPEYPEYKGVQEEGWKNFNINIQNSGNFQKFVIRRGLSDDIVPTFEDNFFDIIFVDGNHETEYVYRDGVMSFQKVKSGGYIVFDDYNIIWPQTMAGVNKFINEYSDRIRVLGTPTYVKSQLIIQKL